jgi:hypothetical protein
MINLRSLRHVISLKGKMEKITKLPNGGELYEYPSGNKYWFLDGNIHRIDGPAIESFDGKKEWWVNNKRHRIDGPAILWLNGDKFWYVNDNLHREDGPAIEYTTGFKEWWLNGQVLSCTTQKEFERLLKLKAFL